MGENLALNTMRDIGYGRNMLVVPDLVCRDNDNVGVLHCGDSGAYVLSSTEHLTKKEPTDYAQIESVKSNEDDTYRRIELMRPLIRNKMWVDFGCGHGELLEEIGTAANHVIGVEKNIAHINSLLNRGISCIRYLSELDKESVDVLSMFHVFEHLHHPVNILRRVKYALKPGGFLVIEVPHAKDYLGVVCDKFFSSHMFWSEHLILHTRLTLVSMLHRVFGIPKVALHTNIVGVQRYPVSNHMHWLAEGKPGGHKISAWNTKEIAQAYEHAMQSIDRTDTLLFVGRV